MIEKLFVIKSGGTPLVIYPDEDNSTDTILGSTLIVIKKLSLKLFKRGVKSFVIGEKKYYYKSTLKNTVYIIFSFSIDLKKRKIKRIIKSIVKKFKKMYDLEFIKNWKGKLNYFDDFIEYLKENY